MDHSKVSIPHPCRMSWRELVGDHQQRYCLHCDRWVVNLSALTPREKDEILAGNDDLCVAILDPTRQAAPARTATPVSHRAASFGGTLLTAVAMLIGQVDGVTAGPAPDDPPSESQTPDEPLSAPPFADPNVLGRVAPPPWPHEEPKTPGPLPDQGHAPSAAMLNRASVARVDTN